MQTDEAIKNAVEDHFCACTNKISGILWIDEESSQITSTFVYKSDSFLNKFMPESLQRSLESFSKQPFDGNICLVLVHT